MLKETKMLLNIITFITAWNEISGACRFSDLHFEHGQFIYESDGDEHRSTVPRNYVLLFKCDDGYRLSEWRSIYCSGKKWNNGPPHCIRKESCSDPDSSFHASRNGSCCSVGNRLTYSCIEGYRLVGDETITCLPGGKWSAPRPRCRPPINICPDPPTIANGRITAFIGIKHGDYYMPFEKIRILCNRGFVYSGATNILTCRKEDSQWSEEFGECREAFCPRPHIAHGSIIELENNNATKFPEKFEITYVCNTGFRLIFDYIRDCRTGKWSGSNPYCEKIVCHDPRAPENGKRSGGDFNVGSKVVFSCLPDYVLLGSAERHCLPNGQWSGELTRCDSESTHCPDPGIPINGMRIGDDFNSGDTVLFTCEDDFILAGSHERECLQDRSWSGPQTVCLDEDDFDDENTVIDTLISALDDRGKNITEHNYWYPYRPEMFILYFAFDVSKEMREKNFKSSIRFAQAFVKKVGVVTKNSTRVGALTFGYGVKIQFYPQNFTTTEDILDALDKIKCEDDGFGRKTAAEVIREEMLPLSIEQFGKGNQKSIIFFLTSGRTDMGRYPAIQGGLLIEAGCEIFCIGMTGDKRRGELYELASWPLDEHVFILQNYLTLDWLAQEISINFSQCGLIFENGRRTGMIGGRHLKDTWPWMAELYQPRTRPDQNHCGGVVVGRKWILTASRCLGMRYDRPLNDTSSRLTIKLGTRAGLMNGDIDTTLQKYKVEAFFVYPDNSTGDQRDWNLALIKLNREIKYNRYVRPICLPPEELPENSSLFKPKEHVKAIKSAYLREIGKEDDPFQMDQLLQSNETCFRYLQDFRIRNTKFAELILCAGNRTHKRNCGTDRGSPLIQSQMNDEGRVYWTLIGISNNYVCTVFDSVGYYTKVQKFVSWINDIINGDRV